MSSVGVGLAVFFGCVLSVPFVRPEVTTDLLLTNSAGWGLLVGLLYRLYEVALTGLKPPNIGR